MIIAFCRHREVILEKEKEERKIIMLYSIAVTEMNEDHTHWTYCSNWIEDCGKSASFQEPEDGCIHNQKHIQLVRIRM